MSRKMRMLLISLIVLCLLRALPTSATPALDLEANGCEDGFQASGAIYRICMPGPGEWNGDLVLYAHGYIAYNEPIAIPEHHLVLPDGTSIPEVMNGLGFAFATTSYSTNGLAFREGVADIRDLVDIFVAEHGLPGHTYVGGASEGGLVTALSVEAYPDVYDGGLAVCGPVGSLQQQFNTMGDFRVLFDYFFPGVLPGTVVDVPQHVIDEWSTVYEPAVANVLAADPHATKQLLRVTHLPTDRSGLDSPTDTVQQVLWYNVFGAGDAFSKLGGQPYDNRNRIYLGSANDFRLNREVPRYAGDPVAMQEVAAHYETSGQLISPLITLHTTGDPVVPYWHEKIYKAKVYASGSGSAHVNIPVFRYGHCNFTMTEVLVALALMVYKSTGWELSGAEQLLPDAASRNEYLSLAREVGALH